MSHALVISASAQGAASTSSTLARSFTHSHQAMGGMVDWRDLSITPPPPLDEAFVAGAFTRPEKRDGVMRAALAYSDHEIAALKAADILVIALPMYNFGVPALLKGWFDQIIRPGETFASTGDPANPYRGLVGVKHCLIITVRGSEAFAPAGTISEWNFLDPHIAAMLALIGIEGPDFIDCSGLDDRPEERASLIYEASDQVQIWLEARCETPVPA